MLKYSKILRDQPSQFSNIKEDSHICGFPEKLTSFVLDF